jgi:hypothetical protein
MRCFFRILIFLIMITCSVISAQVGHENFASESFLSAGKWYKLAIIKDGIFRIDFSELRKLGLEYPSNPRIFGNNCGQLSYMNDGSSPDDLKEIPLYEFAGSDGLLNEGDYILFYGQGTGRWIYDTLNSEFNFKRHNYSDTAFYFLTSSPTGGKRLRQASEPGAPANYISASSDANFIHEIESENLIKSGREWFEPITYLRDTEINPEFKDIISTEPLKYSARLLARSPSPASFRILQEGSVLNEIQVPSVDLSSTTGTFAQITILSGSAIPVSQSPHFAVRFLNNNEISAKAWLDFVTIQARRQNTFEGQVKFFTDSRSVTQDNITEFKIRTTITNEMIWDVTDPFNIKLVNFTDSGNEISFRVKTDTLRTFAVFIPDDTDRPLYLNRRVRNQNLHASQAAGMIIITHPLFADYCAKLAAIHAIHNNIQSLIVTTEQIYNEFSGGVPDIVAIRNFVRMKYLKQKGTGLPLRYLLLFGDGSFENKIPPPGNPNYIPTWQSKNSNVYVSSFCSDDFYGLLEDGEGEDTGTEDVGIGRIPASDTIQAGIMVSKIAEYLDPSSQGDWKNMICLVADDEDGNSHMIDAEGLAEILTDSVPWINIDKIYFDAFHQETSATGEFYPDVTKAIDARINSGALIFNYIGHGNENSLGHERVLTTENVESWRNKSKLPLFITATCEFSRFDDININTATNEISEKSSAGEKILFKDNGGSIALMSTSRLVYSAPNYQLNRNLFGAAFERDAEGNPLCLGDIIRIAKNRTGGGINKRNFLLLGDPAVRLSYPWQGNVVTDSINGMVAADLSDTLKALSVVTVKGHIDDPAGNLMKGFNGTVEPVVFDKSSEIETLANDGGQKMKFSLQQNILFSGTTNAEKGAFSFTFIVPRDIDYNYGSGKISYYANDGSKELNGMLTSFIIGGFANVPGIDTTGPLIRLFLNDTLFKNGGITDPDPVILAMIEDLSGINATGSGIGHDLIFWMDNDKNNYTVLNNYFENDPGSFAKGSILYPLSGLTAGRHSLNIRAWDNFNNSTEKTLDFTVKSDKGLVLYNLLNFPNPVSSDTRITLEHNRPGETLEVTITIYNLGGQVIRIIDQKTDTGGYQLPPVLWDGNDSHGKKVGRGLYPYRVEIRTSRSETSTVSGRMIIL